jgi:hypothetical protein
MQGTVSEGAVEGDCGEKEYTSPPFEKVPHNSESEGVHSLDIGYST